MLMEKLGQMDGDEEIALAKFGRKALPELLEIARNSKNSDISNSAANAIEKMTDKTLVGEMWGLFNDEKEKARFF